MYTCPVTKSCVTKHQHSQHRKCSAFLLCNRELPVSNFGSGINFSKWELRFSRCFPQFFGIAFHIISRLLPFHCIIYLFVISFPFFIEVFLNFLSVSVEALYSSETSSGTMLQSISNRSFSSAIKLPGSQTDQWPHWSTETNIAWNSTSIPRIATQPDALVRSETTLVWLYCSTPNVT
jgi:hypothetical protein